MELRSRSRSQTPFQTENFIQAESFEGSNHVTVTRSTKRATTFRTAASGGSSEHFHSSTTKPIKSTKSSRNAGAYIKTSDYSSEEADESMTHISQNEKNQIIEDAKAAANGNTEVSALNLYRRAGRYWDKYPKTDYTYSPHSRDRVEIAPGVVQMPNMSRRTIHSYDSSTNTDSYYDKFASGSHYIKQRLFSSNNNVDEVDESYKITRVSSLAHKRTIRSTVTSVFVSVYTVIFWCFYTVYEVLNSSMVWFAKKLHRLASSLMLLDTWLLRKTSSGKRTKAVVALCLLPLLFFAGLHALLASGVSLAPFCHPHCGRYISTYYHSFINAASSVLK